MRLKKYDMKVPAFFIGLTRTYCMFSFFYDAINAD